MSKIDCTSPTEVSQVNICSGFHFFEVKNPPTGFLGGFQINFYGQLDLVQKDFYE